MTPFIANIIEDVKCGFKKRKYTSLLHRRVVNKTYT